MTSSNNTGQPDGGPDSADEQLLHEKRNFLMLALHQVTVRVSWVFKTESVVIPAFLDSVAGAGWVRGCLPMLNRLAQSFPPMWLSDNMQKSSRKKWWFCVSTWLMGLPFLILTGLIFISSSLPPYVLPVSFLMLYTLFFAATGINRVIYGTLQGKLIPIRHRGRLLGLSGIFGSVASVAALLVVVNLLKGKSEYLFLVSFSITGIGMMLSGFLSLGLIEPEETSTPKRRTFLKQMRDAVALVKSHSAFRKMVIVSMLASSILLIFPHFQTLARVRMETEQLPLMIWVIAQNIGAGCFSLLLGSIGDRFGNRLAIRTAILVLLCTPMLALGLSAPGETQLHQFYWVAYFFLGMTPVADKAIINYTLEAIPSSQHAHALSTLKLCLMLPLLFSVLVGLAIDYWGFEPIFWFITCLLLCGLTGTWFMNEPRDESEAD